ncbi:DUF485 domain-containing protein [Macrococcoides caseolyticum]|uniref:DUF485 domain-containing protein n=1 Tax=Macrococcus caseolyticus (strain JCSC5402) TaxID=458233 RepID=B9E979_MACCJ|nr:DUF485 domain-containing protein [Macrococcus caseolyticus]BAH16790.1 conserved hypothetical protein [Macrococcus caseolyticus JCSC5402]
MEKNDYNLIAHSDNFKQLQKERKSFIFPILLFFIIATILFPILTGYTNFLNKEAFWNISWAWIYAFMLFIMVWTHVKLYMSKAKPFDIQSEAIINECRKGNDQ